MKPAAAKKKVMIIGGGPAGMKSALVAAKRGHQVSLYEKKSELGGQVNLAAKAPTREEFGGVARYLINQLSKVGVQVHLGAEVTPDMIMAAEPDAVVVATGSVPLKSGFSELRPDLPGLPGCDQENVITVWEVLEEKVPIGEKVVIVDNDGHWAAVGAAEFLADKGKQVRVLSRLPFVGFDLAPTYDLPYAYPRLLAKGLELSPHTAVKEIRGETVVAYNIYTQEEENIEEVDTVVLAMGSRVNDSLYWSLKGKVKELHRVGDCVAPRRVANAIWEGHVVGRKL